MALAGIRLTPGLTAHGRQIRSPDEAKRNPGIKERELYYSELLLNCLRFVPGACCGAAVAAW
jgi:hypothetical protein